MPRQLTVVDFDEIFHFAKDNYDMEWNTCCDVFHRGSILCNEEGKDKKIHLEEIESSLQYLTERPTSPRNEERKKGYEIVIDFMKQNNLTEMHVLND